jgi:hypothetical protein
MENIRKDKDKVGNQRQKDNTNKKYKDSVFTKLFGEKDKIAELYNAIHDTNYTHDDITLLTLENIIFIGRANDLSFTVDNKLIVLMEHQATINPNMPLRCLFYIARQYQSLADNTAMYSSRLTEILPPEFIVIYNGKDEYPEETTLYLSDAYVSKGISNLELRVKVYNINKGYNTSILSRSKTLSGYAMFVTRVRENIAMGQELPEAMEHAVKDCIREGILQEFLERYGSDVVNMLSLEFNLEDAQRVWKNDGIEIGKEIGKEMIAEKMLKRGVPICIISEDTGLSFERIEQLALRMKELPVN